MTLLVLLLVAIAAGAAVALLSRRASRSRPGQAAAQEAGRAIAERPRLRVVARRLDPSAATGLALTCALIVSVGGGLLLSVLAVLIRSDDALVRFDRSVAAWGRGHGSGLSDHVLNAITFAGKPPSIIVVATVLAIEETIRTRSRWVIPFVALVVCGNGILTTVIKEAADRVRPTFNPIAHTLGPSFPSGHSSWSAACFAAAALVLSRGRTPPVRAALAGAAAAVAVAVAGTRVLLGVHWLSDVIAGLALGWAWFAVCAIAFGGRLLEFGAAAGEVDEAAGTADRGMPAGSVRDAAR